jgi:tRNA threonylcarbamoyladenosine biosynthesis protein TsaB
MGSVLLALDTATEQLSVALVVQGRVFGAQGEGGAASSAQLLPTAERLLREAGLHWQDLNGIGFGQGPGAFTGLRTACSVAQGLAFGLDLPVWPLDTLQAVLEDACEQAAVGLAHAPGALAWVLQDARMGEVYVALYQRQHHVSDPMQGPEQGATWTLQGEVRVQPVAEIAAQLQGWTSDSAPVLITGSALQIPVLDRALRSRPDDLAARCHSVSGPSPRALARLMLQAHATRPGLLPEQAVPRYVRDKVALTVAERAAAAATPA